jgi:hypothetical protein
VFSRVSVAIFLCDEKSVSGCFHENGLGYWLVHDRIRAVSIGKGVKRCEKVAKGEIRREKSFEKVRFALAVCVDFEVCVQAGGCLQFCD